MAHTLGVQGVVTGADCLVYTAGRVKFQEEMDAGAELNFSFGVFRVFFL